MYPLGAGQKNQSAGGQSHPHSAYLDLALKRDDYRWGFFHAKLYYHPKYLPFSSELPSFNQPYVFAGFGFVFTKAISPPSFQKTEEFSPDGLLSCFISVHDLSCSLFHFLPFYAHSTEGESELLESDWLGT